MARVGQPRLRRWLAALALVVLPALLIGRALMTTRLPKTSPASAARTPSAPAIEPSAVVPTEETVEDDQPEHRLAQPTGRSVGVSCADARQVVRQIQARFPAPLPEPEPARYGELVASWLDPHGLWSAASDAPPGGLIALDASALAAELRRSSGPSCEAALRVGGALERWMGELVGTYDDAFARATRVSRREAAELAAEPLFDDGEVTTPARDLARDLGHRLGAITLAYGDDLAPYVAVARERYFPAFDAGEWQGLVLSAALRGYVAAVDPHGQWAPLDEEWSLYAGDPSFDDPDRLWGDMVRTALGVRVVDRPEPPLEVDDVVLAIDGVLTAGLSVEQIEELARATSGVIESPDPRQLVVLRVGDDAPRELTLELDEEAARDALADGSSDDGALELELVPYGRSYAAVVTVPYVRDDLGERLSDVLDELGPEGPPMGLLLDLRGNAGGSMDGATNALSVFLPDVPVFPLLHGGHLTEVLRTPQPGRAPFRGPLAVLVDGSTASAAEMIAGALERYERAAVIGQPTYGKGCVQEYFEDEVGAGVLRLTTRLFTLPDGSPVQRRGVLPSFTLELPPAVEHEADLPGSLGPSAGPDVRVPIAAPPRWPPASGRLGPCRERVVCAALRQAQRAPSRAFRGVFGGRDRRRGDFTRR